MELVEAPKSLPPLKNEDKLNKKYKSSRNLQSPNNFKVKIHLIKKF